MEVPELKRFEEMLMARRRELLVDAGRTVGGMTAGNDNTPDPSDRATLEAEGISVLRIRDRERKLLSKIDAALERIQDGTYGICEECDGPIAVQRLQARPVTTLCIDCKAIQEDDERRQRRG